MLGVVNGINSLALLVLSSLLEKQHTLRPSSIHHQLLEHQFYNACYAVDAITILEKRVMNSSLMHITVLLQDAPKYPTDQTNLLNISMLT